MVGALVRVTASLLLLASFVGITQARDLDGRYAASPLKGWFDSLSSSKGPCCSDADGLVVQYPDWESKSGHFRVKIEDVWYDVPDDAVLKQPNLFGKTMVWPIKGWGGLTIRCFIPGPMT